MIPCKGQKRPTDFHLASLMYLLEKRMLVHYEYLFLSENFLLGSMLSKGREEGCDVVADF